MEASWLHSEANDEPRLLLSSMQNYTMLQIRSNGQGVLQPIKARSFGLGPEDLFDEGKSFDLSPVRTPPAEASRDNPMDTSGHEQSGSWNLSDDIDDTFQFKR